MLVDSAHIQESDVKYINRTRIQKELDPIDPLYTIEDAEIALQQFVGKNYDDWFEIDEEIEVCFTVVGHILGAAAVNLKIKEEGKIHTLCYTGDIGRKKHHIIKVQNLFLLQNTLFANLLTVIVYTKAL